MKQELVNRTQEKISLWEKTQKLEAVKACWLIDCDLTLSVGCQGAEGQVARRCKREQLPGLLGGVWHIHAKAPLPSVRWCVLR